MPERSESSKGTLSGSGWRGRVNESETSVRHNWQRDAPDHPVSGPRLRRAWRRLRLWGMLLGLAGLIGAFAYYVLFAPVQTPVLAVAATAYHAPLPPNGWARDDLDRLLELDGKTLAVSDLSAAWDGRETGLAALERELRLLARRGTRSEAIVISLSLHGGVDGDGVPCLIPPGASPLESGSWLPVPRLLSLIEQQDLPPHVQVVLIFDADRIDKNWSAGILEPGFAEGLQRLAEARGEGAGLPANVWILNSAGPGQTGQSSAALGGSVFGHFLRRGLAAEADAKEAGGDGDRRVTLRELHGFLARNVDRWSRWNAGTPQVPMLLGGGSGDVQLAWTLGGPGTVHDAEATAVSANDVEVDALWREYQRWEERGLSRTDPLAWQMLGRELVWLEQCLTAGVAYEPEIVDTERRVRKLLRTLEEVASRGGLRTVADMHAGRPAVPREAMPVHTRPLAEQLALESDLGGRVLEREALEEILARYAIALEEMTGVSGALLRLQEDADAAAVSGDLRAHRWIRPILREADELRRRALDAALCGDTTCAKRIEEAGAAYRRAQERGEALAEALRVRDAALADLPWLAQCATVLRRGEEESPPDAARLLESLRDLEVALNAPDEGSGETATALLPFAHPQKDVSDGLSDLQGRFNEAYERVLTSRAGDTALLREMLVLLRVPLLPDENGEHGWGRAEQRNLLRRAAAELTRELALATPVTSAAKAADDEDTAADDVTAARRVVELFRALGAEDAEAVGDVPASEDRFLGTAEAGEEIRARLRRSWNRATGAAGPVESLEDARASLAERDFLVRGLGSFVAEAAERDPAGDRRRFHVQQVLFAHCARALDDFLGPVDRDGRAAFEVFAADYLDAALAVDGRTPPVTVRVEDLRSVLSARAAAARDGLRTAAEDVLVIDPEEEVEVRARVEPGSATAIRTLPNGTAAVRLASSHGGPVDAVVPVDLEAMESAGGETMPQPIAFRLPGETVAGPDAALSVATVFRGHAFPARVRVTQAGGVQVVHLPRTFDSAEVVVEESLRRQTSVVFVLDCSWSMTQPIQVEGAGGEVQTRFDEATRALQRMLDQLATRRDVRVGVLLYGHRVGYSRRPRVKLFQERYRKLYPFEESLEPYADAEPILPLGRFGVEQASDVAGRLELIEPLGETPLYFAMLEALKEFDRDAEDTERSLIVITDGLNEVSNPPQAYTIGPDAVQSEALARRASISIAGFQLSPDESEPARREFTALARATGGAYVPASEATSLVRTLEEFVAPSLYVVRETSGREETAQVRTPVSVSGLSGGCRELTVSIEGIAEQVELCGGELLRLVVAPDGDGLRVVPYEINARRSAGLVRGPLAEPTDVRLWAHAPIRRADGVDFEFSLQHARDRFTPRPRAAWLEVTPVLPAAADEAQSYVFYEADFEPGTSVPVLRCLAHDWPAAAQEAEVRFWCAPNEVEPFLVVDVEDALERVSPMGDDGPDGWTFAARMRAGDVLRLIVVERGTAGTSGARVAFEGSVVPRRVVRMFDTRNRIAMHTFEFDPADEATVRAARLEFSQRPSREEGACSLERPLIVEVGGSGAVLPLDADVPRLPSVTATE